MSMRDKKPLMVRRTLEYLDLHRNAPESYPLNVEAVAAFVPVSRRLFYKHDPEISALLDLIRPATDRPNSELPIANDQDLPGGLDDEALEREIAQVIARAVWAMQKFVGHHKSTRDAVEAALAAHDLDEALGTLSGCQKVLRPLVREHEQRRRNMVGTTGRDVYTGATLTLFDEPST